jgi:cell division protein FtsI (penicillin-binding protein 3)
MLVADPTRTTPNAEAIAKILAERLHLDYFDLLAKLTKKNDTRFVYVARRVPSTLASSVMDELKKHEYVGVDTRPTRCAPTPPVTSGRT